MYMTFFFEVKGRDMGPSMATHTWNLCSAFNPSKCTHTVVNTHTHTHTHTLWRHTRSSGQPYWKAFWSEVMHLCIKTSIFKTFLNSISSFRKDFRIISKSSNIFLYKSGFCTSNSWPVYDFALSSVLLRSSLLTGAYAMPTSNVIH